MSSYKELFLAHQERKISDLVERAENMAAWGVPDNESTGHSQSDLCAMIRQLCNAVRYLQNRSATD